MGERKVEGIIEKWSEVKAGFKKDNTSYAKISCKLVGSPDLHSFFGEDGTPKSLVALQENAPVGSKVSFDQWQTEGSQFWNFRAGSFVVNEKGNGQLPASVQSQQQTQTNNSVEEFKKSKEGPDWDAKERRTIRQNCGRHASAYIDVLSREGFFKDKNHNDIQMAFYQFAESFEKWVYREKGEKLDSFSSANGDDEVEEIKVEEVKESIM